MNEKDNSMSIVTVKTAVERYDFEDYGTLEESGRYVKFEDYAALTAQRDALASLFGEIKELHGFSHRYFITSKGYVFSMATGSLRQLKPSMRGKSRNQYLFIRIEREGTLENRSVHHLVAENFISEKPFDGAVINHIDGNKQNNDASNLEWTSISENTKHAYKNGLAGGMKHGSFKGPICTFGPDGFGYVFFGKNQGKELGFTHQNVFRCLRGITNTHRGHSFARMDVAAQLRQGGAA